MGVCRLAGSFVLIPAGYSRENKARSVAAIGGRCWQPAGAGLGTTTSTWKCRVLAPHCSGVRADEQWEWLWEQRRFGFFHDFTHLEPSLGPAAYCQPPRRITRGCRRTRMGYCSRHGGVGGRPSRGQHQGVVGLKMSNVGNVGHSCIHTSDRTLCCLNIHISDRTLCCCSFLFCFCYLAAR